MRGVGDIYLHVSLIILITYQLAFTVSVATWVPVINFIAKFTVESETVGSFTFTHWC